MITSRPTLTPEVEPLDSASKKKKRNRYTCRQRQIRQHLLLTALVSNVVESAIKTDKSMTQVLLQKELLKSSNEPTAARLQAREPMYTTLIDPP
jgi:hypothetical protein